ncbi:MAG: 3-keto-disaccharide hydrolase [Pirellulales bacterium]
MSLASCLLLAITTCVVAAPPEGFTSLYNGKNLDGWHGYNPHTVGRAKTDEAREKMLAQFATDVKEHWSAKGDEIYNDGHGAYLTTDADYGDYEFLIDYKTVAKADSGIYLRGTPQVQIWDTTEEGGKWKIGADKGSGGLWNNSKDAPGKDPSVLADKPFGEWNSVRIIQVGARTSVWLNGKQVVDHAIMENYYDRKSALARTGPIHLQTHGGPISWKNIYIREINSEEANMILASKNNKKFKSVFNGKDLKGWTGAVENYEVRDGAIACKPKHGGVLHTEEQYRDFVVRLEFQLPPGGNNGLAIRYPGNGNTAYIGMTELQVLDSEHPKYSKLDARQYHGSAYGMAAAQRGYLRPTGDWNFQEVTVQGSNIKVELNGSVILDADIAEAKDFMANSPHPGKDRTEGYFGFAGHNDPVLFRAIKIKSLK